MIYQSELSFIYLYMCVLLWQMEKVQNIFDNGGLLQSLCYIHSTSQRIRVVALHCLEYCSNLKNF